MIPDTILHPDNFKASQWSLRCPMCNYLIGFDGEFHWNWVLEAIGYYEGKTKIRLMDFDGVIERHYHYLVFETKDKGVIVPKAQKWTLDRLRNMKSLCVMNVEGKIIPISWKSEWGRYGNKAYSRAGIGEKSAKDFVKRWFDWANKN